ncbi:MAG: hypothetical protein E6565_08435, partial [Staphylococcus epidermidis]|nr:hypothetical protein [Staphylococcus epidermidis]
SSRKKVQQFTENYDTLLIGIEMSRETLYLRINKRSSNHDCKRKHPRPSTREL